MMTDVRMDRSRTESIVGREAELEALLRAGHASPDEHPDGAALRRRRGRQDPAADRGARPPRPSRAGAALVGHCLDFGDTSMPYLPFAEMLGQVAEADPELAADGRRPPRPGPAPPPGPGRRAAEGLDRAEVFEAVHALVEELASRGPVVMVVEDAHWADASTRDLISFLLSRRLPGRCLLRRDATAPTRCTAATRCASGSPSGCACPASSGSSSTRSRPAPSAPWSSR